MSLEELSSDEVDGGLVDADPTRSRAETKARKALSKLGLKRVDDINRVVLRRPKGVLFVIAAPEVYKSPNSDCYIVFGEAKVEDPSIQGSLASVHHLAAAEQAEKQAAAARQAAAKTVEADEDDGEVDETGLQSTDIELLMSQASCSRKKAVAALRASDGDVISAIMNLA